MILFPLVYCLLIQVNTPYSTVLKGDQGLEAGRVIFQEKKKKDDDRLTMREGHQAIGWKKTC